VPNGGWRAAQASGQWFTIGVAIHFIAAMIQPLTSGRLTKSFFFSLPTGVFLASNVNDAPGQPLLAESVLPVENRERL
jgi:hypothetical protein